jgi:hypothetical protein
LLLRTACQPPCRRHRAQTSAHRPLARYALSSSSSRGPSPAAAHASDPGTEGRPRTHACLGCAHSGGNRPHGWWDAVAVRERSGEGQGAVLRLRRRDDGTVSPPFTLCRLEFYAFECLEPTLLSEARATLACQEPPKTPTGTLRSIETRLGLQRAETHSRMHAGPLTPLLWLRLGTFVFYRPTAVR